MRLKLENEACGAHMDKVLGEIDSTKDDINMLKPLDIKLRIGV